MFLHQVKAFVWGTLVHEMMHAFLMVVSWEAREQFSSSSGHEHGEMFRYAADRLAEMLHFDRFSGRDVIS